MDEAGVNRYGKQELAAGIVFFVACGWLIVDAILSVPEEAPSLWPLVPMFAATVWYVINEHRRSKSQE
ncbi:MAG: hypothetical protein JSW55_06425 [Chloroflexota bacterium]|nr:MAG: hypothetical protein JSW55_06425 [Chloroflexota bacterium]